MAFQSASQLGIAPYEDASPSELWSARSKSEVDTIVRAVYKQVLGNSYVMTSERLVADESKLQDGRYSVRDFVRAVAKSELYRTRFFHSGSNFRYIETTCKNLLGRAPDGYDEVKQHTAIIEDSGFEADIDSYIDSDEYLANFGDDTVPYMRGYTTGAGTSMVSFTHFFQLQRGPAGSDVSSTSGNHARLNRLSIQNRPACVVPPSGGSDGWAFQATGTDAGNKQGAVVTGGSSKMYRIETTGYRANVLNRVPKYRCSNKVYLVPFDKLITEYKRIRRQGGVIASVTPAS
jgi:phycoerythrin-associated linker protein